MSDVLEKDTAPSPPEAEKPAPVPETRQYFRGGFWSLVIAQFQGALNETGLKNLVVFIVLSTAMEKIGIGSLCAPTTRWTSSPAQSPRCTPPYLAEAISTYFASRNWIKAAQSELVSSSRCLERKRCVVPSSLPGLLR
jgi:hypothetical protein